MTQHAQPPDIVYQLPTIWRSLVAESLRTSWYRQCCWATYVLCTFCSLIEPRKLHLATLSTRHVCSCAFQDPRMCWSSRLQKEAQQRQAELSHEAQPLAALLHTRNCMLMYRYAQIHLDLLQIYICWKLWLQVVRLLAYLTSHTSVHTIGWDVLNENDIRGTHQQIL